MRERIYGRQAGSGKERRKCCERNGQQDAKEESVSKTAGEEQRLRTASILTLTAFAVFFCFPETCLP